MALPTVDFDEAAAIDTVDRWVSEIQEKMTAQYSREWLEATLSDHLQQGLVEALQVIEWAEGGDVIADAALRHVYAEMRNRHEAPPVAVQAYVLKTLVRGPVARGRGHFWYDDWRRNIGIAVLVHWTAEQFGLHPTRNRARKRRRQPSASGVVTAALGRRGVNVRETTVQNISSRLQGQVLLQVQVLAFMAGLRNVHK
jgi:hypothetical protein